MRIQIISEEGVIKIRVKSYFFSPWLKIQEEDFSPDLPPLYRDKIFRSVKDAETFLQEKRERSNKIKVIKEVL